MGDASGHLKSVSFITHRPLPSYGITSRITPVRGWNGDKVGHAPGGGSAARFG
jgi:hypothetical protein